MNPISDAMVEAMTEARVRRMLPHTLLDGLRRDYPGVWAIWHDESREDLTVALGARPEQRETLDEATRGLTVTDEWGSLLDTTERCPICRRKWSKHDDFDEAHFAVAEDVASMLADLAAAPVQPVTDDEEGKA